jgi:hypothetical protein
MSPVTPDRSDDDEEEEWMRRALSEAGDPVVMPRAEYVSTLRSLILDRLNPPRRARRWTGRLLVGSGVAAAALAAVMLALALSRPANAWAQVARALQGRPWVHTRAVGPGEKESNEVWFSPKNGVSAVRRGSEVEYHDHALRTFTKFVAAEGVIYHLPENAELLSHELEFFRQLLDPEGPTKTPILGMEVVSQRRRDVTDGGRTWVDIELTLRVVGGDRELKMRIRVDSATKLPHSFVLQSRGEPEVMYVTFDYPDRGPADIYDLGAPRTAKIVDRTPGEDLDRILAGLKTGRVRFDDYRGIMDWGDNSNIKRTWRKGRKWRAETLLSGTKKWPAFPRDADAAWWKAHQNDFTFMVDAICDGEKVYYYQAEGNPLAPEAKRPPAVRLSTTQAINPSDDPFMPLPIVFPEHISHTSVGQPSHEREFLLDAKPADGPPDTIHLRVRDTRFPAPGHPDHYQVWVSPSKGYMALRSESSVFEGSAIGSKFAYTDTMIMEGLARSPSGFWYPTRVRRQTSDPKTEQVWTYLLDFEAQMPDEMFQPLK